MNLNLFHNEKLIEMLSEKQKMCLSATVGPANLLIHNCNSWALRFSEIMFPIFS